MRAPCQTSRRGDPRTRGVADSVRTSDAGWSRELGNRRLNGRLALGEGEGTEILRNSTCYLLLVISPQIGEGGRDGLAWRCVCVYVI